MIQVSSGGDATPPGAELLDATKNKLLHIQARDPLREAAAYREGQDGTCCRSVIQRYKLDIFKLITTDGRLVFLG